MAVITEKDNGKLYVVASRLWPDGSRLRRRCPNRTVAKALLSRVDEAIVMGTWRGLKRELSHCCDEDYNLRSFSKRFLTEYCAPRLTPSTVKRYALSLRSINDRLGNIGLADLKREHVHGFVKVRSAVISQSSINKDLIALKSLFSYAAEIGVVEGNLLAGYPFLRVQEKALRIPTTEEFRRLVVAMPDPIIGAMVAVAGETGLRKSEILGLTWDRIDLHNRRVIIEKTKGKRVRQIPLSAFTVETLRKVIRYVGVPHIFVHQDGKPWKNPEKPFRAGRKASGLDWITWHVLRHYRGTTWLRNGVDIVTVQALLGHQDLKTTARYLHYVQGAADEAVRTAEERELESLERATNGRHKKDESA